ARRDAFVQNSLGRRLQPCRGNLRRHGDDASVPCRSAGRARGPQGVDRGTCPAYRPANPARQRPGFVPANQESVVERQMILFSCVLSRELTIQEPRSANVLSFSSVLVASMPPPVGRRFFDYRNASASKTKVPKNGGHD